MGQCSAAYQINLSASLIYSVRSLARSLSRPAGRVSPASDKNGDALARERKIRSERERNKRNEA